MVAAGELNPLESIPSCPNPGARALYLSRMRPYREYPLGSISMHDSPRLRELLAKSIARDRIRHVLETGTHEGLGSTRFLAETFAAVAVPRSFVTIEANWRYWRRARRNLWKFSFVQPLWGATLDVAAAIAFVQSDDVLKNHERYPDIFIDDVEDPIGLYVRELRGELGELPHDVRRRLLMRLQSWLYYRGERLLEKHLRRLRGAMPLVVLDSAGGVGLLEFQTLITTMAEHPYLLLLDDIHHVKHFRSLAHIREDPSFEIIGLDESHGWVLARHG